MIGLSPYQSYVYAYPHKTAYRPLSAKPLLADLWRGEQRDALSFYAHIPFCEVRCGFCNLFTRTGTPTELPGLYLDALERQARAVRRALDESGPAPRFAVAAIGGGTPTYLSAAELSRLFDLVEGVMGVDLGRVPLSVEASPATATPDRLAVLAERGTTRLSLGVQSFDETEARSAVRPQQRADVEAALDAVRSAGIPILNIDLIYGIDGQTERSWIASLDAALAWKPEEIYLYPLYVRPLTGLGRLAAAGAGDDADDADAARPDADWDVRRLALYRSGRDHLRANGYEQTSMRMFRRADGPTVTGGEDYTCQSDGMTGLGCGARSYTGTMHYSFDYAVSAREVRAIIDEYTATTDFTRAQVGFALDADEQRRRHVVQSLLQADGLDADAYRARFGSCAADDFPGEFDALDRRGFLGPATENSPVRLTDEGLAWSDAIGPLFFSPGVRDLMRGYEVK